MGRLSSWFGASSSGSGGGSAYSGAGPSGRHRGGPGAVNGAPDFLAQSEDPDRRRLVEAQSRSRGAPCFQRVRVFRGEGAGLGAPWRSPRTPTGASWWRRRCAREARPALGLWVFRVLGARIGVRRLGRAQGAFGL